MLHAATARQTEDTISQLRQVIHVQRALLWLRYLAPVQALEERLQAMVEPAFGRALAARQPEQTAALAGLLEGAGRGATLRAQFLAARLPMLQVRAPACSSTDVCCLCGQQYPSWWLTAMHPRLPVLQVAALSRR